MTTDSHPDDRTEWVVKYAREGYEGHATFDTKAEAISYIANPKFGGHTYTLTRVVRTPIALVDALDEAIENPDIPAAEPFEGDV